MFAAVYVTQHRLVALAHRTVAMTTTRPQRAYSGFAVMYVTQHHLSLRVGRGDYDPPLAGMVVMRDGS